MAGMALQEHLGDGGGGTEVAVDLERRMVVKQVGKGRLGDQGTEVLPGLCAVAQAGEEVDDPGAAPAGVPPAVGEASLQRVGRRACQPGRALGVDQVAGMQRKEV